MARPDLASARALHDEVCAIDLHADTPKLMDAFGYDLAKRHAPLPRRAGYFGHVDIPRMREGGLGAQFFGMWTFPMPRAGCAQSIHRQLDALDASVSANPTEIARCVSRDDVDRARAEGKVAALSGIEGAQALEGRLENVEVFARRGVRYLGLAHFSANDTCKPAMGLGKDDSQGLSAFGREVVLDMDRTGMILDLAHINRRGFFEALELHKGCPIISHTGVAGVKEHWRNVDDEQLRAVAGRGGVIGVIFAPRYLGADGIEAVCDHLLHIIKVVGEDAPALGSDYDGAVRPPLGLEDVSCLPALTAALLARGTSRQVVKKLLGENALRVLGDVPARYPLAQLREAA
jgi:membrane dipeptidase